MNYPNPWRLAFDPMCPEWDERSQPYIVDANNQRVPLKLFQLVGHPGERDIEAEALATRIIAAVNNYGHA